MVELQTHILFYVNYFGTKYLNNVEPTAFQGFGLCRYLSVVVFVTALSLLHLGIVNHIIYMTLILYKIHTFYNNHIYLK